MRKVNNAKPLTISTREMSTVPSSEFTKQIVFDMPSLHSLRKKMVSKAYSESTHHPDVEQYS